MQQIKFILSFRRKLSLRLNDKIFLAIFLVLTPLFSIFSYLIIRDQENTVTLHLKKEAQTLADLVSHAVLDPYLSEDYPVVQTTLNELSQSNQDVLYVKIMKDEVSVASMSAPTIWSPSDLMVLTAPIVVKKGANAWKMGTVELGYSSKDIHSLVLNTRWKLITTFLVCYAILFIFLSVILNRMIIRPIRELEEYSLAVGKGDLDLKIDYPRRDELGRLANAFANMATSLKEHIKDRLKQVRIENELALASTVQQRLFPPEMFESKDITICGHYESATECGGDWWGYFETQGKVALFIADATGHGLPSALITAAAHSCMNVLEKLVQDNTVSITPNLILKYANRAIYSAAKGQVMMTFFAAVIDVETRSITYSNAGHNAPWLFKKNQNAYETLSLLSHGSRLGELQEVEHFEERTIPFEPEDVLFLYTDGLIEGTNTEGTPFGKKHTRKIVESSLDLKPNKILESVLSDFKSHRQQKQLDDDITLAVIKLNRKDTPKKAA